MSKNLNLKFSLFLFYYFGEINKTIETPSEVFRTSLSILGFTVSVREANMLCISVSRQHSQVSVTSVLRAPLYVFGLKIW